MVRYMEQDGTRHDLNKTNFDPEIVAKILATSTMLCGLGENKILWKHLFLIQLMVNCLYSEYKNTEKNAAERSIDTRKCPCIIINDWQVIGGWEVGRG